jgi:hypothetical protein
VCDYFDFQSKLTFLEGNISAHGHYIVEFRLPEFSYSYYLFTGLSILSDHDGIFKKKWIVILNLNPDTLCK